MRAILDPRSNVSVYPGKPVMPQAPLCGRNSARPKQDEITRLQRGHGDCFVAKSRS